LSDARARVLETIELCRKLVDSQVRPDREFAGWAGQEVLVHLTAYTRAASAILRAAAEAREPTPVEFYGRELTDDELEAIRDLDEQNERIRREHSSLSWYEALERCKAELGEATLQATPERPHSGRSRAGLPAGMEAAPPLRACGHAGTPLRGPPRRPPGSGGAASSQPRRRR